MNSQPERVNFRILVADDNPSIHDDFRKILCPEQSASSAAVSSLVEELFGDAPLARPSGRFEMDSAFQGQEALAKVEAAEREGRPYSLAFMDVRMPPGWDGIETITHIWKAFPHVQVVVCTAYSDYSWEQILQTIGETDSLVILKKPFDNVEVLQLAHTLTKKWAMTRQAQSRMADLDHVVQERTHELLEANRKLQSEIDRRAAMETALRVSEERFRKAFETVPVPLFIHDAEGRFIDVNPSFADMCGYPKTELIGRTPQELNLLVAPEEYQRLQDALRLGQTVRNVEIGIRRRDEALRQTLVSVERLDLGAQRWFLAAMLDLTESRELESQLRQVQKMEAVGQLAAGVAHDFNNLLTVIHGYASLQLARRDLDADVAQAFAQVREASERAASLTRQLLAFGRRTVLQRKPMSWAPLLERNKPMFARLLGEGVQLEFVSAPGLPYLLADETSLEQILLNLVLNSRDAMPEGGQLRIATEFVDVTPTDLQLHPDRRPGKFVVLSVADTGCGMGPQTLRRIFEPFFTTKPFGKGIGLGLSTVYGIVKQHEGWVEVRSQPGLGTTFRIFIPASETEGEPATEATLPNLSANSNLTANCRETILVVEDDPNLRQMVAAVLVKHGYRVVQAASGAEALAEWIGLAEDADLLLSDLVLPDGISGPWLARRFLSRSPKLKVLFTSGYNPESLGLGSDWKVGAEFIPKPFGPDLLMAQVHRMLAGGSSVGMVPA